MRIPRKLSAPAALFAGLVACLSGCGLPALLLLGNLSGGVDEDEEPEMYPLQCSVSPMGGGTVWSSPPGGAYPAGSVVVLTADPGRDYRFDSWQGDLAGSSLNPATVTVTAAMTVTACFCRLPYMQVGAPFLRAACTPGAAGSPWTFEIWNPGTGTLGYTLSSGAPWLSCSPESGALSGERDAITVSYDAASLDPGVYSASLTALSPEATNSPLLVPVELTVATSPILEVDRTSLLATCAVGNTASSCRFEIRNAGVGTLAYTVHDDASWLTCSPTSGESTGERDQITVYFQTEALAQGDYSATVSVGSQAGYASIIVSLSIFVMQVPWIPPDVNKVVCAELYRQGLMEQSVFDADQEFGRRLRVRDPVAALGYRFWAEPLASLMRRSATVTNLVNVVARPWSQEMAYRMGARDKGSPAGAAVMAAGTAACRAIGRLILLSREQSAAR